MPRLTPSVHTLPSSLPFADLLVKGIMDRYQGETSSLSLAETLVLLPTQRAVRTVREAFLRHTDGTPTLLPRLMAIADPDEDSLLLGGSGLALAGLAPAINPLHRQLLLTRLVMAYPEGPRRTDHAAALAHELGTLLDHAQAQELDLANLKTLVPEDFASHWQVTLEFLSILTQAWPTLLNSLDLMDSMDRRVRLYRARIKTWQENPPRNAIIAAGLLPNAPALSDLLKTIANLLEGHVILPGLDTGLRDEDTAWLKPEHPQFLACGFLKHVRLTAADVTHWTEPPRHLRANLEREKLLRQALLPAERCGLWRELPDPPPYALEGLIRLDSPGLREEASTIALMMRDVLEDPGKTAALVTPDRTLARRVAAELRRWDIEVDDSGGQPLSRTPVFALLLLMLDVAADPSDPIALLSLLKHPMTGLGLEKGALKASIRRLEKTLLRGPRPSGGFDSLKEGAKRSNSPELVPFLDTLERAFEPLIASFNKSQPNADTLVQAHLTSAEQLCRAPETAGAETLWAREDGEAAATFFTDLLDQAAALGPLNPSDYKGLLETLASTLAVRPRYGTHPRLAIYGLIEARLLQPDLVILGGLNEGTWPPDTSPGPWMSRPMQNQFGLLSPEHQIGQAAHDFVQMASAREVVLSRAERVEGTPTVRARWLRRLEARLQGIEALESLILSDVVWPVWQDQLDDPGHAPRPVAPPAPKPPLEARLQKMYVTQVELWMRDPYAVFAKHILKLRPLEDLDADPGAADYGNIIHDCLDQFVAEHPVSLPENPLETLIRIGQDAFGAHLANESIRAFWWPRFERVAAWFIDQEIRRRPLIQKSYSEEEGSLTIPTKLGPFTLSAKADRIDLFKDGTVALVDYKTGAPPSKKEVMAGYAPQMPLEAAIMEGQGFGPLTRHSVSEMNFWRLKGSTPAGEIKPASDDIETTTREALDGLVALVDAFADPNTPYAARPNPEAAPKYSDYEHLARLKEWGTGLGEGGE